jgi:PAS domain S-box-containing protein/diguanylate cyclase (GGDEF)-like protein
VRRALAGEAFTATVELAGRSIETHHEPLRDTGGNVVGLIGVGVDNTEGARAAAALRESEERLRTVVGNVPMVLFALDREGIFTVSEGRGLEALGLKPGQAVGLSVFDVYRDELDVLASVRRALAGEAFSATVQVAGLAFETHYEPVRDASGGLCGVIGVAVDVTERVRAAAALRESEERLRTVVGNVPVVLFALDRDAVFTLFEGRGLDALRLSAGQVVGRSVFEFEEQIPKVVEGVRRALAGEAFTGTVEIGPVAFEAHHEPLRNDRGETVGVIGVAIDVTERLRAETALRESEERFRRLAENAEDIIYRYRLVPEPGFEYVSPAATNLIGYAPEEHYADPELGAKIVHPDDAAVYQRWLEDPAPGRLVLRWIHKDGSVVWSEQRNVPIYDAQHTLVAIEGIARDITEQKRGEALLAEQKRVLELIALGAPLLDVLDTIVRMIEAQAGRALCSICLVNGSGDALEPGAAPNLPLEMREALQKGAPIAPHAGACGAAAYRRQPVMVESIADDPMAAAIRDAALQHGIRACWSTPILSTTGSVLGTVAIFYRDARGAKEQERRLVEVACNLAGIAIERTRSEQALQNSEEILRATLESTADGILVVNNEGKVDYANPLFAQLWRIPDELLETRDDDQLLAYVLDQLDDPEAFLAKVRDLYQRPDESFDALRFKDGRVFERYSRPLLRDGAVAGRVWSFRDASEREWAQQALRESEQQLNRVVETSPDLIAIQERDGTFRFANSAYMTVLGYGLDDLRQMEPIDLVHPDDREATAATFVDVVRDGVPTTATFRMRHAAGRSVVVEARAQPLLGADGKPAAVVTVSRDVTERARAEEALRESEAKFRSLAETVAAAAFIYQGTQMVYVNSAAEAQTGYSREELLGMSFWDMIHPDFRDVVRERGMARQRGEQVPARYEVKLLTKSGEARWLDFMARNIEYEGQPAVLGTAFDITERKRAEEALREQARRDPLTAVLNHAAIVEELRALAGTNTPHAVAMMDVDGLKAVNDTYGHQVGDQVLVAAASALVADGTLAGRYGGDEFVAVLPRADRDAAERYRESVLRTLASAGLRDPETGAAIPVVATMGLAIYPEEAESVEDLIRLSDSAMYSAKRQRPVGSAGFGSATRMGDDRAARVVGEIVPLLTHPGDLNEKLRLVGHRLSIGAGYDAVNFILFSPLTDRLAAKTTFARVPQEIVDAWSRTLEPDRDDPIQQILDRTRRPLILDDPQNDERLAESQRNMLRQAGFRSVLITPMVWQEEVVGTLSVVSKREAAFTPRDAQFLTAVATQVTAIVRMSTLVDQLQVTSTRLSEAQEEAVLLLAASAEAHDQTTGWHLQNVRAVTEALARELGQDEAQARELGLAAVLHDIGKIRVPDTVLASSGQLQQEEWELMTHHTTWGAQFLAGRAGFELATTIARSHHERWDGTGYPDGLAAEAIPEAATIVSVSDSFDAMIHDRPYRRGRSVERAVQEIVDCSGSQFSPRVVQALARLYAAGKLPLTGRGASRAA